MTTLPLRTRRHQQAIKDVAFLSARRDQLLDRLARLVAKLKAAQRTVARYEKSPPPVTAAPVMPVQAPAVTPSPAPAAIEDGGVPDFLRRTKLDATAQAIKAEQDERRKAKSRGRIATMKAKQSGETKRMPLEGREAIKAIFG